MVPRGGMREANRYALKLYDFLHRRSRMFTSPVTLYACPERP